MKKISEPRIKDKILKYLLKHSDGDNFIPADDCIAALNLDTNLFTNLVQSMAEADYVSYQRADFGAKASIKIKVPGKIFISNGGFVKKARREWMADVPRQYWWLVAALTFLIGFFGDVFKERLKPKEPKAPIELVLGPGDTLRFHQKDVHEKK